VLQFLLLPFQPAELGSRKPASLEALGKPMRTPTTDMENVADSTAFVHLKLFGDACVELDFENALALWFSPVVKAGRRQRTGCRVSKQKAKKKMSLKVELSLAS
jgi:hypothetical protein